MKYGSSNRLPTSGTRSAPADDKGCERGLTWIKPSFVWMMYRCGWGTKAGQETVLAVEITREGFEWALLDACLPSYERGVHPDRATWQRELKRPRPASSWDPERDLRPAAPAVPVAATRPLR